MSARPVLLQRLYKAPHAALYLDMSVTKFRELVTAGRIAPPREDDGLVRWDVRDLDAYADALPHRGESTHTPRAVRAI